MTLTRIGAFAAIAALGVAALIWFGSGTEPDTVRAAIKLETTEADERNSVEDLDALMSRVVEINDANQNWLYLDSGELTASLTALVSAAALDTITADIVDQVDELRGQLTNTTPVWWLSRTLAVRVVDHDPNTGTAQVQAWAVQVISQQGSIDPSSVWKLTTLELVWERDDWRLVAYTDQPAPSPAPATTAWHPDAGTFDAHLSEFALIGADGSPQFPSSP